MILRDIISKVNNICFSPDGKFVASSCDDLTAKIWDLNTGKCIVDIKGHNDIVLSVDLTPSDKQSAIGSSDRSCSPGNKIQKNVVKTLKVTLTDLIA